MSGQEYHKLIRALLASDLPAAAKVIGIYLMDMADKDCIAWPSLKRIGRDLKIGISTVKRSLNLLESDGWIENYPGSMGQTSRRKILEGRPKSNPRPEMGQAQNDTEGRPKSNPRVGPKVTHNRLSERLNERLRGETPPPQATSRPHKASDRPTNAPSKPPTVEELIAYAATLSPTLPSAAARRCWEHWEAREWIDPKTTKPVESWKGRVVTWRNNEARFEREQKIRTGEISGVPPVYPTQEEYNRVMGIK